MMQNPPDRRSVSLLSSDNLHEICLRVYHHDTDTQQIMHHAHYLIFAERARTEFLRDLCHHYGLIFSQLPSFVVLKTTSHYKKAVGLDDFIKIKTRVCHIGGSYLDLSQTFCHNASEIFELKLRLVCTNTKSHSVEKLPNALVSALEAFSSQAQHIGRPHPTL